MNKILQHFHCLNSTVLVFWFSFAFLYVCMYVYMYVCIYLLLLVVVVYFCLGLVFGFFLACFVRLFLYLFCSGAFLWVLVGYLGFFKSLTGDFFNASIQFYKGNRLKIANIQLPMLLVDFVMCVSRAHYTDLIA